MVLVQESLSGGFEDPVLNAQAVFRTMMDGFANPGTIQTIDAMAEAPAPFSAAQAAIALCLADHDTAVWLSPACAGEALSGWISFHCGAPVTSATIEARFAFFAENEPFADFSGFSAGTQEYPDRSATLVIELPSLTDGLALTLKGPGIRTTQTISPLGLPAYFDKRWSANGALFPRGLDVIFTCGNQFLCMPRSVKIIGKEA